MPRDLPSCWPARSLVRVRAPCAVGLLARPHLTIDGRKRPQPRGARPAEYRRPASHLGRFPRLSDGLSVTRRPCPNPQPLRRSPHGGGRSPPSRDRPLTARLVGRPAGRAFAEQVDLTSRQQFSSMSMPLCANCPHSGPLHNWKVQRIRGRCDYPQCDCRGYVPATSRPRPINSYIGRQEVAAGDPLLDGGKRPQPRGARPAEYRRPASRLGRFPLFRTTRITNTRVRAIGQLSRPIVLLGRHVMR